MWWPAYPGWRASRLPWASKYNPVGVQIHSEAPTSAGFLADVDLAGDRGGDEGGAEFLETVDADADLALYGLKS